jgi:hypothetical protein
MTMQAPYTIPAGSADPVDQLYLYALTTYSARTGTPISAISGDGWRYLDAGGSAVLLGMIGNFDLDPSSPAAVLARSGRPLAASVPYVSTLPRTGAGRRGGLKVRYDTLIAFYPQLGRDAGIATFMGRAAALTPAQAQAETAQADSQAQQLRTDTARAQAQADRVSSFQAGDVAAAGEMVLESLADALGRGAASVVGAVGRIAGAGAGAFVGALPPAVIVGGAVLVAAAAVYAVRRVVS